MKILVIGDPIHFDECQEKLGVEHVYTLTISHVEAEAYINVNDLIFDFIIDKHRSACKTYVSQPTKVFLNTCNVSLRELMRNIGDEMHCTIFGFNGMPTLFNRSLLEVSVLHKQDVESLREICKKLNTDYLLVDDRVGLVTPRVISMIINEAYYTVQEGTANREDIDLAMKLGTNYPYGPFEWCERIGTKYIYELLDAVYEETKDIRYQICPLLKAEYLKLK